MDFSYKVIRNRLGSLVANAIQKKIDNNKGGEPFIVVVNNLTTTTNSSEVIQALNENKLVIYKFISAKGNITYSCNISIHININSTILIATFDGIISVFSHVGTTIQPTN